MRPSTDVERAAAEIEARNAPILPPEEEQPAASAEQQQAPQLDAEQRAALKQEVDYLLERVPQWRNARVRQAELEAMAEYAVKARGYSPEELRNLTARDYITLRDAWKGAGKPLPEAVRKQRVASAVEKVKQTGRVRDAAEAIRRRLEGR